MLRCQAEPLLRCPERWPASRVDDTRTEDGHGRTSVKGSNAACLEYSACFLHGARAVLRHQPSFDQVRGVDYKLESDSSQPADHQLRRPALRPARRQPERFVRPEEHGVADHILCERHRGAPSQSPRLGQQAAQYRAARTVHMLRILTPAKKQPPKCPANSVASLWKSPYVENIIIEYGVEAISCGALNQEGG